MVPCVCQCVTLEHLKYDRDYKIVCIFIKIGRHINDEERMIRIDFRGQSSKDKVLSH